MFALRPKKFFCVCHVFFSFSSSSVKILKGHFFSFLRMGQTFDSDEEAFISFAFSEIYGFSCSFCLKLRRVSDREEMEKDRLPADSDLNARSFFASSVIKGT